MNISTPPPGDDAPMPATPTADDSKTSLTMPTRSRWHYMYFALAAFDIIAISASLCFSRTIINDFSAAVSHSHELGQRQGQYADMSQLIERVSDTATEAAETKSVGRAQGRIATTLGEFDAQLKESTDDIRLKVPHSQQDNVLKRLQRIDEHMLFAREESDRFFGSFQDADESITRRHLSALNTACEDSRNELFELIRFTRGIQDVTHDQQIAEAGSIRGYQSMFGGGVLIMVIALSCYGHKLSRAVHDSVETAAAQAEALADQEARLRTIFNTAAEGIITINAQGVIESCNHAVLELFRCEEHDIVGSMLGSLMDVAGDDSGKSDEDTPGTNLDLNSLLGKKQELTAFRPDGSQFIVEFAAAEVRFDDHSVITGILHDITVRKEFETELHEARVAAEAATEAKSQFLANMSHEIRTPMTAIIGFSDLLLEPNQTSEERVRCVETVRRNADHLLSLINDILDLSKIEAGKMTVEQIEWSPCDILADVASLMSVRANEKNVDFEVVYDSPMPETMLGDPVRTRQILINLVGNSIKFTKTGYVRIHVQTNDLGSDDPMMSFKVVDTGIGMSEQQVNRLFRPFTQADYSTTRKFGGTGLGLTICKRLVDILGGSIDVTSVPGLGSSFCFDLPTGSLKGVRIVESPADTARESQSANHRNTDIESTLSAKVLLAEDGVDNRRLISHHLKRFGADVSVAENGRIAFEQALEAARNGTPFDMIFMDMQMPVMDGYQASSQLRENGYAGPIVALTAHAMSGDREKCVNAGCDDYLTKPIDPRRLKKAIEDYVPQNSQTVHAPTASSIDESRVEEDELQSTAESHPLPDSIKAEFSAPTDSASHSEEAQHEQIHQITEVASSPPDPIPESGLVDSEVEPLLSEFADDNDMLEIIEMFIDGLKNRVEQMHLAFETFDFDSLTGIAHQLKGAAGGYGYPQISDVAHILEQKAKTRCPAEDIGSALKIVTSMCDRAIRGFRSTNQSTVAHQDSSSTVQEQSAESSIAQNEEPRLSPDDRQAAQLDSSQVDPVEEILDRIESVCDSEPDWDRVSSTLRDIASLLRKEVVTETCADDSVA